MAKYTGKGGEFQVRTVASPETWQTVAQVRRIGSISITADEIEAATLDAGDYRDYLQGYKDPGEMPLEVIWDPSLASHGSAAFGLFNLFDSGQTFTGRIKIPVSPPQYIRVTGFFRDWETPEINPDDPIASTYTLRLGGKPTLGTS